MELYRGIKQGIAIQEEAARDSYKVVSMVGDDNIENVIIVESRVAMKIITPCRSKGQQGQDAFIRMASSSTRARGSGGTEPEVPEIVEKIEVDLYIPVTFDTTMKKYKRRSNPPVRETDSSKKGQLISVAPSPMISIRIEEPEEVVEEELIDIVAIQVLEWLCYG
ncbi:hypothetical protein BDZ91DRAFT_799131 [Kalaharituber pfeilii]|nr:hypothetical protein BDZ91DRAFT_799131 [Kalaharituber pfeilii]